MPESHDRWTMPAWLNGRGRNRAAALATSIGLGVLGFTSAAAAANLPSDQVQASLRPQLSPPDPALTVALELDTGGYSLPLTPPSGGHLVIGWYVGSHPAVQSPAGLTRVASGQANYGQSHPSEVRLRDTPRGRRLMRSSRSLTLTAIASFTPTHESPVLVVSTFTLR